MLRPTRRTYLANNWSPHVARHVDAVGIVIGEMQHNGNKAVHDVACEAFACLTMLCL